MTPPTIRHNSVFFALSCSMLSCSFLSCSLPSCFMGSVCAAERSDWATAAQFFRSQCYDCHANTDEPAGGVDLSQLSASQLHADPEMLHRFVGVLDRREMPPPEAEQPQPAERQAAISALRSLLREAIAAAPPPRAPLRRMNRFQYNNAVKDLLALNCAVLTLPERMMREHHNYFRPASGKMPVTVHVGSRPLGKSQLIEPRLANVGSFPQDLRAEHGFDNRGDHLSMSPLLLESFLKLGQSVVASPDFGPRTCGVWDQLFVAPEENAIAQAEARIERLLTRAFRRPPDSQTLQRYQTYLQQQLEHGASFTEAMKSVVAAVLSSPRFLYIYEKPADAASPAKTPLDPFELATRLSFFLWGSIPDDRLLELADSGELLDEPTLAAEVDRMLRDPKLKRFCDSFPSQWLQLERIISSQPDREKFPDFYFAKFRYSMHMMLEPLLAFETVLIENRSLLELIDSPFTYRSGPLDKIYYEGRGKVAARSGPTVLPFRRVEVTDPREGGVITTAAVMTMTSGAERTKPITRGAWLATVVFNTPPPPPPADVPPLGEKPPEDERNLTLRERLTRHREQASCAGCHEQIDPLGFALENFGPTGKWRERYANGREIDATGVLFQKHSFTDVAEFKQAILAEKDRFVRGFAEHLLSFALARETTALDSLTLDEIVQATAADDYRIQTLIHQIVRSEAFRTR